MYNEKKEYECICYLQKKISEMKQQTGDTGCLWEG